MKRKGIQIILISLFLWICVFSVYQECIQILPYLYDMHDGRYDMFHRFKFLIRIINIIWFLSVSIYLFLAFISLFRNHQNDKTQIVWREFSFHSSHWLAFSKHILRYSFLLTHTRQTPQNSVATASCPCPTTQAVPMCHSPYSAPNKEVCRCLSHLTTTRRASQPTDSRDGQ